MICAIALSLVCIGGDFQSADLENGLAGRHARISGAEFMVRIETGGDNLRSIDLGKLTKTCAGSTCVYSRSDCVEPSLTCEALIADSGGGRQTRINVEAQSAEGRQRALALLSLKISDTAIPLASLPLGVPAEGWPYCDPRKAEITTCRPK